MLLQSQWFARVTVEKCYKNRANPKEGHAVKNKQGQRERKRAKRLLPNIDGGGAEFELKPWCRGGEARRVRVRPPRSPTSETRRRAPPRRQAPQRRRAPARRGGPISEIVRRGDGAAGECSLRPRGSKTASYDDELCRDDEMRLKRGSDILFDSEDDGLATGSPRRSHVLSTK